MNALDALVTQALTGISAPVPLPPLEGPLAELTPTTASLADFLRCCALLDLERQACALPAQRTLTPPNLPGLDEEPQCIDEAGLAPYREMLRIADNKVQCQWFKLLSGQGRRVPSVLWPALLDLARVDKEVISPLRAFDDPRAHLLATINPEWSWYRWPRDPIAIAEAWPHAREEQRLLHFAELFPKDRAAAMALLSSDWQTCPNRLKWLERLDPLVGPEEIPFLRQCLSLRSGAARFAAAKLLSRLGCPELCAEVEALMLTCFTTGKLTALTDLDAPQDHAPLKPFGIVEKHPTQGTRRAWLEGLISLTPLSFWTPFGAPARLLKALADHDWRDALEAGFRAAAINQRDTAWILAIRKHLKKSDGHQHLLLAALPQQEQREQILTNPHPTSPLAALGAEPDWDVDFSERVIALIWPKIEAMRSANSYLYEVGSYLNILAKLHPQVLNRLPQVSRTGKEDWDMAVTTIEFFQKLNREVDP